MTIYVSNLSFRAENDDLKNMFIPYGEVTSAIIVKDKILNRSRGFGFVEMQEETSGNEAIAKLNGQMVDGRALVVNVSNPRERNSI